MSAAAFAKGLLDLEGQLTPILVSKKCILKYFEFFEYFNYLADLYDVFKVSLVSKDSSMLDGLDNASIEMEEAKVGLLIFKVKILLLCYIFSST